MKGREKELEEISKYYQDSHQSLANKNGALEFQLKVARDWFKNEAKLVQQHVDQIEASREP